MTKVIQVIEVRIYRYTPDLSSEAYVQEGVTSIEEALAADKDDVESGDFSLDEIVEKDPITTYTWSVVDE